MPDCGNGVIILIVLGGEVHFQLRQHSSSTEYPIIDRSIQKTIEETMENSELDAYFERVAMKDSIKSDEQGLKMLHQAHLTSIPFENLDIHLGRSISLEPGAIFHKLVSSHRGGYCFEMNGLFNAVLVALNFRSRPLLARVWYGGATEPLPRTHMILLVEFHGRTWLADVGFGGPGLLQPIPLEMGRLSRQLDGNYRLVATEAYGIMLQRAEEEDWVNLYSFVDESCLPADLHMAHYFSSTSPESIFTHMRMACLATTSGRRFLFEESLAITENGKRSEWAIAPGADYMEMLSSQFGLKLDFEFEDFSMSSAV